eukprot:gene15495-biopygen11959
MATREPEEREITNNGLDRLRRIRGGNRATVTKVEREAYVILRESEDMPRDTVITKADALLNTLREKKKYLHQLNEKIMELCDIEDIEREVEESDEINTNITEIITRLDGLKIRLTSQNVHEERRSSTPNHLNHSHTSSNSRMLTGIRLPKFSLGKFNGDVMRFQAFWQSFTCTIDENEELPKIQKMSYLVNALEGQAYKAIEGMDLTEGNYDEVKEILKARFGKTQQIISSHMQALLNLGHKTTMMSTREVYDNLNIHIRGLKSLGVTSKEYGSLLVPVVMTRLPSEIAIEVARKTTEDVWDIEEILEIVRKEIEAREVSTKVKMNDRRPDRTSQQQVSGTTRAFVTADKQRQIQCFFCKNAHYASNCTVVQDVTKRKELLKNTRRCFLCMKIGHTAKRCQSTIKCRNCGKRHNTATCEGEKHEEVKAKEEESTSTMASKGREGVLLQTAQAIVYGDDKTKKTKINILFDGGSQRSYITEELKKKLGLKGEKKETVNVNTFGTDKKIKNESELVTVNIEIDEGVIPIQALSFPTICSPITNSVCVSEYAHLAGLKLADSYNRKDKDINLLIGANYYFDFVTGEAIKGSTGPTAMSSKLGWLLSGPVSYENERSFCFNVSSHVVLDIIPSSSEVVDENQEIVESLNKFWNQEACGLTQDVIPNAAGQPKGEEQLPGMQIQFNKDDSRYEVSLPWKSQFEDKQFDNQYELSKSRLNSLHSRLRKTPELLKEYDDYFQDQIAKGIIEKVPPANRKTGNNELHYLCHHGVVRRDRETTKLRVVFDGSARMNKESPSLNDRLEIGTNYMPLLFDTLIRFRMKPIAMTADIEKAFLQIQIHESDKDKLRFLWFDDVSKPNPSIIELRHKRLVFGLTSSPSILGETIRKHVAQYENRFPEVCKVLNRLYADDMSCVATTKQEALEIYETSKMILAEGGFNLRKWASNDKDLIKEIHNREQRDNDVSSKSELNETATKHESQRNTKILGMNWNNDLDVFYYDLKGIVEFAEMLPKTKRSLLKIAAKIFDPLSLVLT